jgi:hypothetical protein
MRRIVADLLLIFVWFLFAARGVRAEDMVALYRASWAGLPAASVALRIAESGAAYRDEIRIETKGLPRWITHLRASRGAGALSRPL